MEVTSTGLEKFCTAAQENQYNMDPKDKVQPQNETLETRSEVRSSLSNRSSRSNRSNISAAATKARAKVIAAQAKLNYAQKEADLLKEQAKLEAAMHVLQAEKETEAALAEAEFLEGAVEDEREGSFHELNIKTPPIDSVERICAASATRR